MAWLVPCSRKQERQSQTSIFVYRQPAVHAQMACFPPKVTACKIVGIELCLIIAGSESVQDNYWHAPKRFLNVPSDRLVVEPFVDGEVVLA